MKKKTILKKKTAAPQPVPAKEAPRRSVRFTPDPLTIAVLAPNTNNIFRPTMVGLVLNESFGGCSILVNHDEAVKKDQTITVKVGQLGLMKAKVVWVKNLEESIYKIGLKFID